MTGSFYLFNVRYFTRGGVRALPNFSVIIVSWSDERLMNGIIFLSNTDSFQQLFSRAGDIPAGEEQVHL
ncbi:MAG TPA: hypothetical protein VLT51_02300, partial [Anaerolineales bacterium]|nr:hypothetical protein [Anaerolineales bacterium]